MSTLRKTSGWESRFAAYLTKPSEPYSHEDQPVCAAFVLGALRIMTEQQIIGVDLLSYVTTDAALLDGALGVLPYTDHLSFLDDHFTRKDHSPLAGDIAVITGYSPGPAIVGIVQGSHIYVVSQMGRLRLLPLKTASFFYEVP